MLTVLEGLGPIFALILLGYGLRRSSFLPEPFWRPAEKLTYFILFPALLLHSVTTADLGSLEIGRLSAALLCATIAVALLLLAAGPWLGIAGPTFTSVFQGGIRFNTYVGVAAVSSLFGRPGIAILAVAVAVVVPLVNLLSVGVLSRFGAGGRIGLSQTLLAIASNPLILACLLAGALQYLGLGLPPVLEPLLRILGQASLPLGLLAVGAGLDMAVLRRPSSAIATASVAKFVALPLATGIACQLFGVTGLPATVAILFQSLPCAPTSYILARQLGGDHLAMAAIITAQTLVAAVVLPIVILLLPG
jgi:predicted permease